MGLVPFHLRARVWANLLSVRLETVIDPTEDEPDHVEGDDEMLDDTRVLLEALTPRLNKKNQQVKLLSSDDVARVLRVFCNKRSLVYTKPLLAVFQPILQLGLSRAASYRLLYNLTLNVFPTIHFGDSAVGRLQRHITAKLLLTYHDPELASHLDKLNPQWFLPRAHRSSSREDKSTTAATSSAALPTSWLDSCYAEHDQHCGVLELWDWLLSTDNPSRSVLLFAVAVLREHREKLLKLKQSAADAATLLSDTLSEISRNVQSMDGSDGRLFSALTFAVNDLARLSPKPSAIVQQGEWRSSTLTVDPTVVLKNICLVPSSEVAAAAAAASAAGGQSSHVVTGQDDDFADSVGGLTGLTGGLTTSPQKIAPLRSNTSEMPWVKSDLELPCVVIDCRTTMEQARASFLGSLRIRYLPSKTILPPASDSQDQKETDDLDAIFSNELPSAPVYSPYIEEALTRVSGLLHYQASGTNPCSLQLRLLSPSVRYLLLGADGGRVSQFWCFLRRSITVCRPVVPGSSADGLRE